MDFQYSDQPEPHKERTKQILKAHPEVRNLIGRNPVSAVITIFVVALQFVIAYLLADQAVVAYNHRCVFHWRLC